MVAEIEDVTGLDTDIATVAETADVIGLDTVDAIVVEIEDVTGLDIDVATLVVLPGCVLSSSKVFGCCLDFLKFRDLGRHEIWHKLNTGRNFG